MIINEFQRFEEPETDYFELEQWNGGEIYRGEEYLHMQHNGDFVLLEKETILEYLSDHYDFTLELLDNAAIRKVAGE
ncbi:hypothetical protein G7058_00025 [Jeotgalibaca porci]|uniref:Uncharacterized protein n=1 Tax=Jeotgalibaca porci TaxID=1868793 RepID=A0A6G7WED2_9LACT|nr:hypothetical protein [Jeotgalibaca porci]QIK50586.1 hypothetical protein G7058_00025 [Jeotgalibaca porci]